MPSSPDAGSVDGWAAILDDFERELARVDLLAAELADAGVVIPLPVLGELPAIADLGPIPEELRERALAILAAQRDAMTRLEELRADLARHIGLTRSASSRGDVAVYLDRSA